MGAAIVARNVWKSFDTGRKNNRRAVDVLKGVSLTVDAGEMVSIVGPSGSGKSTLLYCLSGLESVGSGFVEVMGKRITKASRRSLFKIQKDHLGFVFQSYNLIPSLNAGENVWLPARLADRSTTKEHVRALLDDMGLADRWNSYPSELSGGEQQRVAIARALASDADVVFADEPTGALDSKSGRDVLGMLRSVSNDGRRSVVMVTHDLEAASLADRVLVLKDGLIVREMGRSTAAEILEAMEVSR
ncbi:ABC transporter [Paraeggerthella hongkongensis]|uniref:ABC transporter ATP-binding protein n=1 Tax=Paraeggerthella sp. TaxID=2897350 RepID=UPI000DF7BF69|nr:ABC transporter [Paraeggerthella hongkongensis]